jgi:hypothetical protein
MDYSPFYYTYSTISQTLAGAFGFLGAVVIYKTQAIEGLLGRLASVVEIPSPQETKATLRRLMVQGNWAEYVKTARTIGNLERVQSDLGSGVEHLSELEYYARQLAVVKKSLARSLFNTAFTIATCFICMPLTNKDTFFGRPLVAWTVLGGVVLYAIVTLWSYFPLVKDLVQLGGWGKEEPKP